jgi:DNA polymerase III subunit epsilon
MEANNKIKEYSWWGENNEPPIHLKTKKQLSEIGLNPKNPVGVIYTRKYDLYLYDPNNPDSAVPKKKASIAQLKALEKGREIQRKKAYRHDWYEDRGRHIKAKNRAIKWAKEVLKCKDDWVILDTETTGLYDAEIVQIGICDLDGKIVLDSLIKPTIPIPPEVIHIHRITDEMVKNAPIFRQQYSQIIESLKDKKVIIYNADFDISILNYCCKLHELKLLGLREKSTCLMEWYAEFCGDWSDYYKSYKWQPLHGNHSAVGDCLAALEVLKEMANSKIIDIDKSFESSWEKSKSRYEQS